MNASLDAFLRSWPLDPWLYVALLVTAAIYLRGYVILRRRAPRLWPGGPVLAFWYPVVRPYPSRPRWSEWLLLPYLLLADVQNTILSALLTFSDRVLYPYYAEMPRVGGLSALEDQSAAGVLMWVPGSLVFLL